MSEKAIYVEYVGDLYDIEYCVEDPEYVYWFKVSDVPREEFEVGGIYIIELTGTFDSIGIPYWRLVK